jgi:hypothetical protein
MRYKRSLAISLFVLVCAGQSADLRLAKVETTVA